MEKNRQNIDNLFKEELGGYTETPPPMVWEALEKRLKEPRKRRFPYGWIWYVSIASFIVLLGASIAWKMTGNAHNNKIAASTDNTIATPVNAVTKATDAIPDNSVTVSSAANNGKRIKKYHKIKTSPVVNNNETVVVVSHKTARRKSHEVKKIAPVKSNKTNDDLYADVDDDQYTVGYSSTLHKASETDAANEDHPYYEQRSQHNMVVAETRTAPETSVTNYGSRPSIPVTRKVTVAITENKPRKTNAEPVNTTHPIARSKAHKHLQSKNAIVASTAIAQNTTTDKPSSKEAPVTNAYHKRTKKTVSEQTPVPVASVAASVPVVKTEKAAKNVVATAPKAEQAATFKSKEREAAITTATSGPIASVAKKHRNGTNKEPVDNTVKPAVNNYASSVADVKNTGKQPKTPKAKAQTTKQDETVLAATNNSFRDTRVTANKPSVKEGVKQVPVVTAPVAAESVTSDKRQPAKEKTIAAKESVVVKKERKAEKKMAQGEDVHNIDKTEQAANKAIARNETKTAKRAATKKSSRSANNNATANTTTVAPPAHVYSNSFSRRTIDDETVVIDNLKVTNIIAPVLPAVSDYEQLLPSTFKSNNGKLPKADSTLVNNSMPDSMARRHSFARRFEAGIKGGYETGFSKDAANKFVVSPYLQYNLLDKFALMTQPSFKVSHVAPKSIGSPKSYYDTSKGTVTEQGQPALVVLPLITSTGLIVYTDYYLSKYQYTQAYDSIVKSSSLGGTYMEFELPVLLKYKINKQLSVYGGGNIVYSKLVNIAEHTYNSGPLLNTKLQSVLTSGTQAPNTPPMSAVLQYNGTPIGNYSGPQYPSKGDLLRLGYMLGFSYEYKKRWLFDVLMQQAMVKPKYEGGENVNAALAVPYFRLTVGYRLTK